jgi:hypothetical protein
MAVFEKKIPRKVFLDDTQVLTCIFENVQNIQGHTVSVTGISSSWVREGLHVIFSLFSYDHMLYRNFTIMLHALRLKKSIGSCNMDVMQHEIFC